MFKNFKVNLTYIKFLISYILIGILPIIIVSIFITKEIEQTYKDQFYKDNIEQLNQLSGIIEEEFLQFDNIVHKMSNNDKISFKSIGDHSSNLIEIQDYLNNFEQANDNIYEILFYKRSSKYLIGSKSSYLITRDSSTFFDMFTYDNANDGFNYLDFLNLLNNSKESHIIPYFFSKEIPGKRLIFYSIPFPKYSTNNYATILFVIDLNAIIRILFNDTNKITITDEYNNILYKNYTANINNVLNLQNFDNNYYENYNYKIYQHTSSKLKWHLYLAVDNYKYTENLKRSKLSSAIVFLIMGFLSGFMIIVFIKINYKPITLIKSLLSNSKNYSNPNSIKDDYQLLSNSIINLIDENKDMYKKIEKNKRAVRSYLLMNLVSGNYKSIFEFNKLGEALNCSFNYKFFQIAVTKIKNGTESILSYITDNVSIAGINVAVFSEFNNTIIILNFDNIDTKLIEQKLTEIINKLKIELNQILSIGIGNRYEKSYDIGKSYLEAVTAYGHRLILGKGLVFFYDDIVRNKKTINKIDLKFELLNRAILNCSKKDISDYFEHITKIIKESNLDLLTAKCFFYDIIKNIINTINKFFEKSEKSNIKSDLPSINELDKIETFDALLEIFNLVALKACSYVSENNNERNCLVSLIDEYIKENCLDCQFSLNSICNKFDINVSTLSNLYKRETGKTIMNVVHAIRIEKAEKLLISTDKTINEIVKEIGYIDSSSFIKRFKKEVGLTPASYRQKYLPSDA